MTSYAIEFASDKKTCFEHLPIAHIERTAKRSIPATSGFGSGVGKFSPARTSTTEFLTKPWLWSSMNFCLWFSSILARHLQKPWPVVEAAPQLSRISGTKLNSTLPVDFSDFKKN
jgi:hypothetical protein